jgi:hypothetical protein
MGMGMQVYLLIFECTMKAPYEDLVAQRFFFSVLCGD